MMSSITRKEVKVWEVGEGYTVKVYADKPLVLIRVPELNVAATPSMALLLAQAIVEASQEVESREDSE